MQLNQTRLVLLSLNEIYSFSVSEKDKYQQVLFFSMHEDWMDDNKTRKSTWKLSNYILCICTAYSSDSEAMMSL